ncbi:histidine phosphatase family protein [Xanthovirga aplysinae]|uniref:histidine phosphatase family protein n=1 Tax=Xanthovirga aplysinae TaxID=2529853 RepID=UPI0012BC3146|nr:phosphoglycerate mutase family protein [Xanthovirga aplysinae]MTI32636.1 hypothetical protein [Xanthovirga aplysinae]
MKNQKSFQNFLGLLLFTIILSFTACQPAEKKEQNKSQVGDLKTTTYIIVRHAERFYDESDDPLLTEEGKERARELARVLKDVHLDEIYATEFTRTTQTATPTAMEKNLNIEEYPAKQYKELIEGLRKNHSGETILIIGHTDSTPYIVNEITGSNLSELEDPEYDNLFIVTVTGDNTKTLQLKFGVDSSQKIDNKQEED